MASVEFELNLPGLNELMKSSEMKSILLAAGQNVAGSAGTGFSAEVHVANFVAISNVYPSSREAAKKNAKDNVLLKAVGGSGIPMR